MNNANEVNAKVKELMEAGSCCAELKALCKEYLNAQCPHCKADIAKKLIAEMEEDLTSIDGLLGFLGTDAAAAHLGAEAVANMKSAAEKAKAEGEKNCICPACQACVELLEHKEWL